MANSSLQKTLTRPLLFLVRMILFLVIVGFLVLILSTQILRAFLANPGLNGLILAVLIIGILYAFRQILRLYPEINWVNRFRVSDPGITVKRQPALLAPMATMLRDRTGHVSLSTMSMRSILESIGARLDEAHETTRYMVGLLIFLGLLGTFWGLLETINSVGKTIGSLGGTGNNLALFEDLKTGLEAPLKGMGTAFSSSLFGLAGSLVLGFLDLQATHAQNRFYNELEEWLSSITELTLADTSLESPATQMRFALEELKRGFGDLARRLDEGATRTAKSSDNVEELAIGLSDLVKQMRAEQKVVREWLDEQAGQQSEVAQALRLISSNMRGR